MSRPRNLSNETNSLTLLDSGKVSKSESPTKSPKVSSNTGGRQRTKPQRPNSSTSLEILLPEDDKRKTKDRSERRSKDNSRPSSGTSDIAAGSRVGSSKNHRRAPPVSSSRPDSSQRRTPTPTKQVSLLAVQRKKDDVDWSEKENTYPNRRSFQSSYMDRAPRPSSASSSISQDLSLSDASSSTFRTNSQASMSVDGTESVSSMGSTCTLEGAVGGSENVKQSNNDIEDSDQFDTDLEDGESSSSESEDSEENKAPNELFMEFLSCVMDEDYENAKKLCTMILMYEPEHEEALNFQKLIDEKIELDEQSSGSDDSDDSDDDDDSNDEDDSDDSDDDSDENSSSPDDSSDNEDGSGDEGIPPTDSGVSSATEL